MTCARSIFGIFAILAFAQTFHAANALATNHPSPQGSDSRNSDINRSKVFDTTSDGISFPREKFLSCAANLFFLPIGASPAFAAAPVTSKDTDSLGAMAKRALRQKPPKVLRRKLSMDFAVLLMRSSYSSLDKLDCVAMDQFQRDFFLIRSSEYENYIKEFGAGMVQQGDLTDPLYFDFISYAQYSTINREITQDPAFVFEEQQGIDMGEDKPQKFVPVVIRRDPTLTNDMLGPEHSRMVGESILDKLEEIFGPTDSAIPRIDRNSRPDKGKLLASLKQLVNLFLVNGYAFSGSASIVSESGGDPSSARGTTYLLSLNAPATIWGGKILQSEKATVNNSFLTKAATEFIRRTGYQVSSTIKYDGTTENISLVII